MIYLRQTICFCLVFLLFLGTGTASAQTNAKSVLDKTASIFTKNGGIRATFQIKNFVGQQSNGGTVSGTIELKGRKFKVIAGNMTTWFDGKTQWSYLKGNDEVNVSEPTEAELQAINPYTFLSLYKKGYRQKMGTTTHFAGHAIYEVQLMAEKKTAEIQQIVLFIDRSTYQPLQIKMRQGSKNWMILTISQLSTKQKLADSVFSFNKKDAPKAEIIDLR